MKVGLIWTCYNALIMNESFDKTEKYVAHCAWTMQYLVFYFARSCMIMHWHENWEILDNAWPCMITNGQCIITHYHVAWLCGLFHAFFNFVQFGATYSCSQNCFLNKKHILYCHWYSLSDWQGVLKVVTSKVNVAQSSTKAQSQCD